MIKKLRYKLTSLALALLCFFGQASAQFQEGVELAQPGATTLGPAIITNATNVFTNTTTDPSKILNVITFKINESGGIYFASNFTASVNFNLELTDFNNNITAVNNKTLQVKYDNAAGAKYKVLDYITYKDYKTVKIIFTGPITYSQAPVGWDPLLVLEVVNEMRTTVFNNLSTNPTDLQTNHLLNTPYQPTPDVLRVVWNYPAQAHENMTQLEWTFVEDEMLSYYNNNSNALFQSNSTRIDLQYNEKGKDGILAHQTFYTYDIPFLFPLKGKLFYRTRAVQRKGNGTLITGNWSDVNLSNNIGSFQVATGHETNLNWQSSTSFAEGGKSKTVIQYFDGSLRGRQTVTKDNTTGNTVVGETIYDLQGRPNIQILPTPTDKSAIQYFPNFNKFSTQSILNGVTSGGLNYQYHDDPAKYFDLISLDSVCLGADSLQSNYGNGRYYSANNPWMISEPKSKYIPDAKGYAYTETRFMDDATERVAAQGGVGPDHQIGSGHETKYFYGKPSQPELDALFGTEVGDADHYSKNMVQDANGQRSVSYVDMHGRTIATALAGDPTDGIDSIINNTDYPTLNPPGSIRNNLLTPTSNVIQGNSIISVNTFLAAANTACDIVYELNPAILQLTNCTNQPICFDCKYNLEISIRSEECNPPPAKIYKYNNLRMVEANMECGTSMGFIGDTITVPTKLINIKTTLAPGSYIITKTLTINDSMFQVRRDSAVKALLCRTKDSLFTTIRDSLIQVTGCGATPSQNCATCKADLGPYPFYKQRYLASISPAIAPETTIREQYITDSLECEKACSVADTCAENINPQLATLTTLRNQMLADMKPFTGQYATDTITSNLVGNVYVPVYSSIDAKYNIFAKQYTTQGGTPIIDPAKPKPFFRNPRSETNTPVNYYYDDNNMVDSSIHAAVLDPISTPLLYVLDTINGGINSTTYPFPGSFSSIFQDSWARSLIKYHPEYEKLKFAESTMRASYQWADRVTATSCYQRALDSNFVNPLISDPYFALPNTQADKDSLTHYLFTGISYNTSAPSPTIWQIANSTVACVAVDSLAKYACMMRDQHNEKLGMSTLITSTADRNEVWEQFKTLYFSYRDEMVLRYIQNQPGVISRTEVNQLLLEGKDLVFANNQDVATQNGAGTWWANITNPNNTTVDTTGLGVFIATNGLDNCAGQRPFWKARLKNCEALQTLLNHNTADSTTAINIINLILDSMVMVCNSSVNAQQPYGSSTVSPTSNAYPSSFESIINNVLTANGIVTPPTNYFCNPYTIEFPKPYGLNPTLFVNTSNVLDTCACRRFGLLQAEAGASTNPIYNPNSFTSMNQFLNTVYHDSLTLVVWNGLQQCGNNMANNCCKNPVINVAQKIIQNGIAGIKLYYTLPTKCDTCKILVYSQGNVLLNTIEGICGTNNYFINLDTCTQYKFVIKCQNVSCGILLSDTARYNGCQLVGTCPTPIISSVVNGINNTQQNITVHYTLPQNCSSCNIKMYIGVNTLVQTINNICGTSSAIFDVADTCSFYKFKVSCTDATCGTKTSPFAFSAGCGVSKTNSQRNFVNATNNHSQLHKTETERLSCLLCIVNVYNRAQFGQPISYRAKCEINFLPGFESLVNDNFEAYIVPNAPVCDSVSCVKPVINNVVFNWAGNEVQINYTLPINCDTCKLKVYDPSNNLALELVNICGTSSTNYPLNKLDSCTKYKFIIQCHNDTCGYVNSDTTYYNGCDSNCKDKPLITAVIQNWTTNNNYIQVNYTLPTNCNNCTINMYNSYNFLVGTIPNICGTTSQQFFFEVPDTCSLYKFVINCNSLTCGPLKSDTAYRLGCTEIIDCTKPVITNVVSSSVNHSFQVFYTLTPGCDSCKISMFNAAGTLVGYNAIICGTTNYTFTNASYDSCMQYSFVVTCYKAGCFRGRGGSSLYYNYAGCNNQPTDTCYKPQPIYLSGYAVIPAFLSCGYVKPCISCEKLQALTLEFKTTIYPAYAGVPYTGANITDAQTQQNMLWARFINYRVGFSKNVMDYLAAYVGCQGNNPPVNALCAFDPPLNSPIVDTLPPPSPCQQAETQAYFMAELQFNSIKDSLIAKFDSLYKAKCLNAQYLEQFYMNYRPKEYHYTLYYYDQAGNLVKTIPPAAVKPNYGETYLASIITARAANNDVPNPNNNEVMATQYRYNSLNQVVEQKTPDAGVSKFWYDRLGRLVVSQNAKQQETNNYSYTQYDELGRITTVGEKPQTQLMNQATSQNQADLATWLADVTNGGSLKKQITRTVYDVGYFNANQPTLLQPVLTQKNLRNRVSYTQLINEEPANFTDEFAYVGAHAAATYYSYDIHGNVDTLVQDNNTGYMKYINPFETDPVILNSEANSSRNRFKKMVYDYDLISGKVNKVSYQPSMTDQFYHRYDYDAENRITKVETSHDSIYWEREAAYEYYRHGPLSRSVIGQNQVQGLDYAYTIQGWLKGVNSTAALPTNGAAAVTSSFDMGNDGVGNSLIARDAYGYSLNYFNGDYKPVGIATPAFAQPFVSITNSLPAAADGVQLGKDLYNGNIRAMMVNIPKLAAAGGNGGILYGYRYDQLNRIKAMNSFGGFDNTTNKFGTSNIPTVSENYKERVTYDPNGNIKSYLRNGEASQPNGIAMDNFTYAYNTIAGQMQNNKLRHVKDAVGNNNYVEDIDDQSDDNYMYDKIGNLVQDKAEGLYDPTLPLKHMIEWTVYGKISAITKIKAGVTTNINYAYDASGNRISKTVKVGGANAVITYYVRDASGNVMSIYAKDAAIGSGALTQTEVSMYGSSRVGVWNINRSVVGISNIDYSAYSSNFTRGNKLFELSNHLGNVLVTVSDKKIGVDANSDGVIDYYNADVVTANDYYPFGSQMPGRKFSQPNTKYRYGFNGKENDKDISEGGQDYGMRIYDNRLGRFLSVDPLSTNYPWYTPYSFAGNKPIWAIDLDGKEEWIGWFIKFMTSGICAFTKTTQTTVTASVTLEAQVGAMAGGAALKGSVGMAVDAQGNIGFFGTGVSYWDLFKIAGGVSNNNDPADVQFVFGAGAAGELGMGVNLSSHIKGLAGTSKTYEVGADVADGFGGEFALGFDKEMKELQSVDVSLTWGFHEKLPSTPVDWSVLNSTTALIGVTTEDLNKIGNVFLEASKIIVENTTNNLMVVGDKTSYNLSTHKETYDNGTVDLYFQVIKTNSKGESQTIFSKLAVSLLPDQENGTNYMRTENVIKTEE
jgi:RHS repeat-associated protein